jgi:hypothetical protein
MLTLLLQDRYLSIAHAFHIREGKRHDLWLIIHRFPASSLLAAAAIVAAVSFMAGGQLSVGSAIAVFLCLSLSRSF